MIDLQYYDEHIHLDEDCRECFTKSRIKLYLGLVSAIVPVFRPPCGLPFSCCYTSGQCGAFSQGVTNAVSSQQVVHVAVSKYVLFPKEVEKGNHFIFLNSTMSHNCQL